MKVYADGTTGYPRTNQPGRTYNQDSIPIYIWDNSVDILDTNITDTTITIPSGYEDIIQKDRDFVISEPVGYSPYEFPHPMRFE